IECLKASAIREADGEYRHARRHQQQKVGAAGANAAGACQPPIPLRRGNVGDRHQRLVLASGCAVGCASSAIRCSTSFCARSAMRMVRVTPGTVATVTYSLSDWL